MKLKNFIEKLNKIAGQYGGNIDVIMADSISVVDPVFIEDSDGKFVAITDKE